MAACGSLHQIFDKPPLPENPILIDSLSSWKQINQSLNNPVDPHSSFTEIFGGLHFDAHHPDPLSLSSSSAVRPQSAFTDLIPELEIEKLRISGNNGGASDDDCNKKRRSSSADSFPSFRGLSPIMNSESLQLCTEGLGFESSDDMEDMITNEVAKEEEAANLRKRHLHLPPPSDQAQIQNQSRIHKREFRRTRSCGGAFPPPISCIGNTGKPRVSFKSFRHDGRFVLKEIRVPSREFLHAFRENGRLKLQFVQPDEGILEGDEEPQDDEEQQGGGGGDSKQGDNGEMGGIGYGDEDDLLKPDVEIHDGL